MQRREFLQVSSGAAGVALIGLACGRPAAAAEREPLVVSAWLALEPDGTAVVQVHKSEMGQGVLTALPMLVAEELRLPFERVRCELAPGAVRFRDARGNQTTGYSNSVIAAFGPFRSMGAAAREMLVAAAATRWGVEAAALEARDGVVLDPRDPARRASYAELLEDARRQPVPAAPALTPRADWRLLGRPVPRVDTPSKVDGSARFGWDLRLPGMRYAMVVRCPAQGGSLRRVDDAQALRVRGVERVLRIASGVVVVGRSPWSVRRGRDALRVEWEVGAGGAQDSRSHEQKLVASLARAGIAARRAGDPGSARAAQGGRWIDADYFAPFLAHAAMEPLACTVQVRADRCDVWLGTQAPSRAQNWAAQLTGLPLERVHVHTLQIGGAFGRRGEWDFVVEAVETARQLDGPVQLLWSREDDMRHDFYRPASAHRLSGRIGAGGALEVLTHRIAAPSIARRRSPEMLAGGTDFLLTQGSSDLLYEIPQLLVDYHEVDLGVPVGFWRSVGHSYTGFVLEGFIDELAALAQRDPLEFRISMLGGDPRLRAVLERAARRAGWGRALPPGRGRGIACMESYGTRVALVAEVEVAAARPLVRSVACAVDCGQVVNPGIVEQQMHSGIVFGLSAALAGEITFERGAVVQSNYHDYPVLRFDAMPRIDVDIIASDEPPGGCGEPSTPLIAPAVCNAIFAATGERVRRLPIRLSDRPLRP